MMAVSSWCPSSAFLYLLLWISVEADLLQGLRIMSCIFFPLTNFSCTWDAGEALHVDSNFTLNVTQVLGSCGEKYMEALTCRTSSPHMSCSVLVYSLHSYYRISVSAESKTGHTESPFICLLGIEAVKLSPPRIKNISSVSGQSGCLLVDWDPLTYSQISNLSHATYEMEYQAVDQEDSRVQKKVVPFALGYATLKPVKQCNFSANTKYAIRLRSRYRSNMSHWSDWSEERMAETPESAPSLAPQLWRHITHHDPSGNRRVLLLWKPLQRQHENGRILGFRLSYLREGGTERAFFPGCSSSDSLSASCTIDLPAEACTIFLKAYNHKGESPEATITIPAFNQTDLPAPLAVTVSSASDHSLLIRWTPSKDPSVTGYVLEWCVVSQNITCRASWQRLSWQTTETVITENIEPERMYNVSVYILYNAVAGQPFSQQGYSRQGAPSCGPTLTPLAAKTSGVYLTWKPLPVDERRGFIRYYKIVYSSKDSTPSCKYF
ncbi:interleukin-6 receptor subunit beta [Erpetoichthys calabaricus]|uniref:interleukin-6 receptor subunit beta n=1 Tax=Erpetoichthys calabaricus TaxID=27687 RepID=UPI00223419F3|nr:interleukin-6 receptor subunit beta [Erpetoichthys calabaricus]